MGVSKPPLPQDTSLNVLSKVRGGRIAKPQEPLASSHNPAVIDLTAAPEPALANHINEDHGRLEDVEVYMVIREHTGTYIDDEKDILKLFPDLEEANKEARRYLQAEHGSDVEWDRYDENIEADGSVQIEASGFEAEDFVVRVEKKIMKRKMCSNHATAEVKPTTGSLKHVYIVTLESRKNVCGSNEDGDIDSVEIQGTYRKPGDANNKVRSLVEEKTEDSLDLECNESEKNGLLHMSVLDMGEEEMPIYDVEKQRVQ